MTERNLYILCLIAATALTACSARIPPKETLIPKPGTYDVEILRDEFGVPHIFGKTDADCAYGVAYAHCEDDFDTIQQGMFLARARLATLEGREALPLDYLVKLFRFREILDEKYETDLSPETRKLVEAYAAGCNHYAALHPKKVKDPSLLPCTGKDIVIGFMIKSPMFFGMDREARRLFEGKPGEVTKKGDKKAPGLVEGTTDLSEVPYEAWRGPGFLTRDLEVGSNTFAVAPGRTPDGATRLAINSHQPYSGPVAWYEVHLHSEEGLNITGGVFPGTPVVLHGHNENLGWAHTVNNPDLVDIYKLEMNPDNENQYRYDGEWKDLEVREVPLIVPLWGALRIPWSREALYSVHGPAIRTDHGVYAIKYAGYGDIGQVEQWYRMDKARNLEEFKAALDLQQIASFNIGYADREGNIAYFYNAKFPRRTEGYDWKKYLPGDTSETNWTEYWPQSSNPRIINPEAGYIFNCNGTPFQATAEAENLRPEDFNETFGIQTDQTNRGYRAYELFDADTSITQEEFDAYKFDLKYSRQSDAYSLLEIIFALDPGDDALLKEAQDVLRGWDGSCNFDNTATAIAVLTMEPVVRGNIPRTPEAIRAQLKLSAERLMKHHGAIAVPWGKVNRLVRGNVNVPIEGGPDILRAVYGRWDDEQGILVGEGGDCYVLLPTWDSEGRLTSRSIHQFGSATLDESSPHYSDQVERFARTQLKPVHMTREEVEANLTARYRPGEERVQVAAK